MTRQVLPHEIRELEERLPRWYGPVVNWAAHWCCFGPWWVPRALRSLPLICLCWYVQLVVWGSL